MADLVVGTNPSSAVVLDADRNGTPDLVVTSTGSSFSSGLVSLLLGCGDGTFGVPQTLAQVGFFGIVSSVATAALNANGLADLVYADGSITTWTG